ncbi:MAG: 4-hydroxy-3-methylbut-2-enyl diphosphate reductase [bacterium]
MKITVAPSAGFCFGVKRAINLAIDSASKFDSELNTLGPIIHNPQVVSQLKEKKIFPVDSIDEIKSDKVIIRSHGIKADIENKILQKNISIIDATCPFVKRSQEYIRKAFLEDYFIIMVGDDKHPEVQSVISFADSSRYKVVNKIEELNQIKFDEKIALISQTTQDTNFYLSIICEVFKKTSKEIIVFNTICDATKLKQEEAAFLSSKSDIMIVVGGYNSANTNKLKNICKKIQNNTYHIETEAELIQEWFIGTENIGITAGASTPDWIIEKVVGKIQSFE